MTGYALARPAANTVLQGVCEPCLTQTGRLAPLRSTSRGPMSCKKGMGLGSLRQCRRNVSRPSGSALERGFGSLGRAALRQGRDDIDGSEDVPSRWRSILAREGVSPGGGKFDISERRDTLHSCVCVASGSSAEMEAILRRT